ncbi:MAG: SH3 domain-containing protein [Actinomycetota bacterium]|nr:SH3 domain-containing protein [Actinomycetota bacterium]
MPPRLGKYRTKRLHEMFCWITLGFTLLTIVFIAYVSFHGRFVVKPVPRVSVKKGEEKREKQSQTGPKQVVKEPIKVIGEIMVVIDGLNFRSSPERASDNVISVLRKGVKLKVVSKIEGWYKVVTPDGKRGYVSAHPRYVRILKMKQ